MTGLCQAGHLTESQLSFEKANGLVIEQVFDRPTIQLGLVSSESLFGDVADAPLTIGQDVKAHGQQIPKQFGTPATAIKNNGGVPARSQKFAHFA
jgi:hypothetical protein